MNRRRPAPRDLRTDRVMNREHDCETWIIEAGDRVIRKATAHGAGSLTAAERAVYDLWAVDYAVRNAGDMGALDDLRPMAAADLASFLAGQGQRDLAIAMTALAAAREDCDAYDAVFEDLCACVQKSLEAS